MNIIEVGMGEGVVSEAPDILKTVGCGSCVVVTLYDAKRKVGGLAHIMLPNAECRIFANAGLKEGKKSALRTPHSTFESADLAIPFLIKEMKNRGSSKLDIVSKMTGGARMFPSYSRVLGGIGRQNINSVRMLLEKEGIPLTGWDTGGSHGRNVEFYLDSGRVVVKALGVKDKEI